MESEPATDNQHQIELQITGSRENEDVVLPNNESSGDVGDDPYAYINKNGFTSEKFKIEIRGLPKFWGVGVSNTYHN